MSTVNKDDMRTALQAEIEENLFEFAFESIEAAGRSFDDLKSEIKIQIRESVRLQAEKLAVGIANGIEALRVSNNENVAKINRLTTSLNTLSDQMSNISTTTT